MQKISFLLCLLLTSLILNAQNNRRKTEVPKVVDLRTIDTLLHPIPTNRELFHIKIGDELAAVDFLDGKYDSKVSGYRDEATSSLINNDILRRGKQMANYIENETFSSENFVNHNTKIKYLRRIEYSLKQFNADIYDGQANLEYYKDMFNQLEGIIVATKNNNLKEYVKNNIGMGMYLNRSFFEDNKELTNIIVDSMCYKYPEVMEERLRELVDYDGSSAVMGYIAKRSYLDVYKYAVSTGPERTIVMKSKDPLVIKLRELIYGTKNPLKALAFFKDYESGKKSIALIDKMTESEDSYFKALVAKQIEQDSSFNYVLKRDLTIEALRYVRLINELHDEKDAVRFKCLEGLTAEELYYLTVLCKDEIYTSSFTKGTYASILKKMRPLGGDEFLHKLKMDKFRTFIRMCANYNTLDTFLATMKVDKKNEIMREFVVGLGDKENVDLEGAVDVADCFGSVNDPALLQFLQGEVRSEYEKNYLKDNKNGLVVYFILYSLFTSKQVDADDSVFNSIMTTKLKMQPINKMPFANLLDKARGKVYEQVVFYGDKDGKESFENFKFFINKSGLYTIDESNPFFIKINSKMAKVPIEIYANRPLDEEENKDDEAQKYLNNYLVENSITPSIMIHRGHSYHLPGTINMMSDDNKVIILGSCGSYHNLSKILERSPDAQMVSSKQVGTKNVNDPIIREVNGSVMNGEDVNWVSIWSKLDKLFVAPIERDLFNDYVPPHKNLGALFLKAYKTLNEREL
jgi:hypothetical protein